MNEAEFEKLVTEAGLSVIVKIDSEIRGKPPCLVGLSYSISVLDETNREVFYAYGYVGAPIDIYPSSYWLVKAYLESRAR